MGKTHYEEYINGVDEVRVKKYSVAVRCSIMVKWLLVNSGNLLKHRDITIQIFKVLLELKSDFP